jgi:hypothetical protein
MIVNPFSCKCCKAKDAELAYLRGLVDRMMALVAPRPEAGDEPLKIVPEDEGENAS